MGKLRILVLEDSLIDAELIVRALRDRGLEFEPLLVTNEAEFTAALDPPPDVILSDYSIPGFNAPDALRLLQERALRVPFIVITGSLGDEAAAECIKLGAADYLLKDRLSRLPEAIAQTLEKNRLQIGRERAERLMNAIISAALDCVITIDHEGRIIEFNPAAELTFGFKRSDVLGKPMAEHIIPPGLREAHHHGFARLLDTRESRMLGKRLELTAIRADGTEFPVELSITATGSWDTPLFTAHVRDITSRILAQQALRESEERFRSFMQHLPGRASIRDLEGRYKYVTTPWLRAFGMQAPEVLGRTPKEIFPAERAAKVEAIHRQVIEANAPRSRTFQTGAGDSAQWWVSHHFPITDVPGKPILVGTIAIDITEQKLQEEKVSYFAYYDSLTGLPNRALFIDRARQQMHARGGEPAMVALILINLERFRNINESLGRHGGDELLRLVARRLEEAFGGKDYLARTGADSYGIVIRDLRDPAGIAHALESQVFACFTAPFTVGSQELRVAAKAGIALFPADGGDADTLFQNAEAALKKARDSGERRLFYAADMNASAAKVLLLETRLRKAVEARQFVLHYQPKIDLAKGTVSGLEALIRWKDPETGLVPPMQFIPLLEETGMILEVGGWAMRKAVQEYRNWNALALNAPRIAVNVSPTQLRQKDFVDVVRSATADFAAESEGLAIEITESVIMQDIEGNIEKLRAIREMGVRIAIDDFGTGYSSLAYLAKLPVNELKIDRSFITTMTRDPDSMTIVSTIISLAHALNLKVVAEGVETEEQRQLLKLLKCDELQGYLISKPVPTENISDFLRGYDISGR